MSDEPTESAPTEEVSIHTLVATRALNLIHGAEEVIADMTNKVNGVEEVCAITRARIAQRREQNG
jgi:hypothetical protein